MIVYFDKGDRDIVAKYAAPSKKLFFIEKSLVSERVDNILMRPTEKLPDKFVNKFISNWVCVY